MQFCVPLYTRAYLPSLSLHVHDQLGREGLRDHEILLMEVSVRRCRDRIDRHKDSLRTVERAEYFLAELWARGGIAIVAGGGLRLFCMTQAVRVVAAEALRKNREKDSV